VDPDRSVDEDNSESLSTRILVPNGRYGLASVGQIIETSTLPTNVTVPGAGTANFKVTATGPDPATRQATLDSYLSGSIAFKRGEHWAGILTLTGEDGIMVIAVSTSAGHAAPSNSLKDGTLGDLDTKSMTRQSRMSTLW
jgi:hypothetical protein